MNKRAAIKEVQAIANAIIDQNERIAKGWDKGMHRDDCVWPSPNNSIACTTRNAVRYAFNLSKEFRNAH